MGAKKHQRSNSWKTQSQSLKDWNNVSLMDLMVMNCMILMFTVFCLFLLKSGVKNVGMFAACDQHMEV